MPIAHDHRRDFVQDWAGASSKSERAVRQVRRAAARISFADSLQFMVCVDNFIGMKDVVFNMRDTKKPENFDEMVRAFVNGLTLEQRLSGLTPEQRLAAFPPEQQLLAMSDDVLRGLPEDYLRSLPADVQDAIYNRIVRSNT
jgi:phosphatidylserine/phosphatidylglycerophosphate/cardiolipin synthase-like enzyme